MSFEGRRAGKEFAGRGTGLVQKSQKSVVRPKTHQLRALETHKKTQAQISQAKNNQLKVAGSSTVRAD